MRALSVVIVLIAAGVALLLYPIIRIILLTLITIKILG